VANNYRYRWGETRPRFSPFKTGVAVSIGDLSYIDSGDSNTLKPASSQTWATAISAPAAPTLTDGAVAIGTPLTNAATGAKATYVTEYGETEASSAGSATPTAGAGLRVTAISLPAGIKGIRYYVETAAGSGVYKFYRETKGESFLITGYGAAGGAAAPASSTLGVTAVNQATFAANFAGVASQCYDGSNANAYGIRDGKLRHDVGGVFEFDCASATFALNALVGPAKASGDALEPQKVVAVSHRMLAIGRVVEAGTSVTKVKVEIFGTLANLDNASALPV
jgi:hypothetical protein